jgi:threonine dehydrogenase-like Zn-dependent dehydrogenase
MTAIRLSLGYHAEYTPLQIIERGPQPVPEHISFEEGATLEPLATWLHCGRNGRH